MRRKGYLVVQQGGASREFYVHAFDTLRQVQRYRRSCDRAAFATSDPIAVSTALLDQPGILDVIQDVLRAVGNVL